MNDFRSSTVSGPGSPFNFTGAGGAGLSTITGSPAGSVGTRVLPSINVGGASGYGHARAQSVALGGSFATEFAHFNANMPYSVSQQTMTGGISPTSALLEPLRTANKMGSISNTNKWSDGEDDDDGYDGIDTCVRHNVQMHDPVNNPGFYMKPLGPINLLSSSRDNTQTTFDQNKAGGTALPNSKRSNWSSANNNSRPTTLFPRGSQPNNVPKGMAMRFDLDISISSGECVLHADAPPDAKNASPVKGGRRTEPNVSHITLPGVSVKTFYSGDTTEISADFDYPEPGADQSDCKDNPTTKIYTAHGKSDPTHDIVNSSNSLEPSRVSSNVSEHNSSKSTHGYPSKSTNSQKEEVNIPNIELHSSHDSSVSQSKTATNTSMDTNASFKSKSNSTHRHGKLCMWVVIQKLDDPLMRLSPCFLDYIQQTLNNVSADIDPYGGPSIMPQPMNQTTTAPDAQLGESLNETGATDEQSTTSPKVIVSSDTKFPVDVVIAIIIETFEIDIDCYPHDKIACMMLLPQTNIVFSSLRNNLSEAAAHDSGLKASKPQPGLEAAVSIGTGSRSIITPPKRVGTGFFNSSAPIPSVSSVKTNAADANTPSAKTLPTSNTKQSNQQPVGFSYQTQIGEANGWIVTVVADDFNVYVFHQFKLDDVRNLGGMYSFGDNSRKDAFSLSVKSVRFNMCRNATLHLASPKEREMSPKPNVRQQNQQQKQSGFFTVNDQHANTAKYGKNTASATTNTQNSNLSTSSCERYRFINMSLILDFGECQFKFDIRKLTELRTFIKHWYREKLIKQAFIAPEVGNLSDFEDDDPPDSIDGDALSTNVPQTTRKMSANNYRSHGQTDYSRDLPKNPPNYAKDANAIRTSTGRKSGVHNTAIKENKPPSTKTSTLASGSKSSTKWESNVIVAANFSSFEVNMQLDSFMGSIKVRTEKLMGTGLLHLTSERHKVAAMKVTLGKSELSSIAATINPSFNLRNWSLEMSMSRPPQEHPEHMIAFNLSESEFRMNYKSNPILMGSFNLLKLQLNDTWKVEENPTSQIPCKLMIKADISWDNAQILLVQSTISDFIIIKGRFIHFYNTYFNTNSVNSPMTVSRTGGPVGSGSASAMGGSLYGGFNKGGSSDSLGPSQKIRKLVNWRRHWPGIVADIVSQNFPFLPSDLSSNKVLMSGRVELKGNVLSVVLMENDIRSSRWLVQSLQQPLVSFSTECQQFEEKEVEMLMVEQNLSLQLLHDTSSKADRKRDAEMAEIKLYHRIGDGSCPIMVASAVKEWFAHTLRNTTNNSADDVGTTRSYYKVENSLIASLPRVQASLTTEQKQTLLEPALSDPASPHRNVSSPPMTRPNVECRFMTHFHQPIQVAIDPKYIAIFKQLFENCSEKIKSASAASKGTTPKVNRKVSKLDDPRAYIVVSWLLDPSIKFLTGTSSSTDPPGINWLWKKLGIENCKDSLPKFTQRYIMDILDLMVAKAVLYDIKKLSRLHNKLPDVIEK